jgi:ABC-type transport system involved in multi-copper enzyme maturation permease subunit
MKCSPSDRGENERNHPACKCEIVPMKFLAILKDSLREALDTTVFYVMIGLSALTVLVVGSFSFRPVSVEEDLNKLIRQINWGIQRQLRKMPEGFQRPEWQVQDFVQTNASAPPWERDYSFTLVTPLPGGAAMGQFVGEDQRREIGHGLEQMFRRQLLRHLDNVSVTEVKGAAPGELHFQVASHGSKVTAAADWPHEPTMLFALPLTFWHPPVSNFVQYVQSLLVNTLGAAVALLLSVIITAFFIPNMLRKGTIDLLLAKPVHRVTLLVYKYCGGLLFMLLNTAFVVLGVWLVLGLRTGLWSSGFFASIPVLTFQFAFYYAVSTLFAVLTRSPIVSILMSCLAWFILFLVGWAFVVVNTSRVIQDPAFQAEARAVAGEPQAAAGEADEPPQIFPGWVYTTADVVHFVLPRMKDLDLLADRMLQQNQAQANSQEQRLAEKLFEAFRWSEAVGITLGWIGLFLGLASWRFATRDY